MQKEMKLNKFISNKQSIQYSLTNPKMKEKITNVRQNIFSEIPILPSIRTNSKANSIEEEEDDYKNGTRGSIDITNINRVKFVNKSQKVSKPISHKNSTRRRFTSKRSSHCKQFSEVPSLNFERSLILKDSHLQPNNSVMFTNKHPSIVNSQRSPSNCSKIKGGNFSILQAYSNKFSPEEENHEMSLISQRLKGIPSNIRTENMRNKYMNAHKLSMSLDTKES